MGRLEDILENIDAAKEFSAGLTFEQFRTNREKRYAIIRALEIVSEAARHIPEAVRDRHRHVPWRQINAAGNVSGPPKEMAVGQRGRRKSALPPNRCTTPSTSASGFGKGGRNRLPSVRSPV